MCRRKQRAAGPVLLLFAGALWGLSANNSLRVRVCVALMRSVRYGNRVGWAEVLLLLLCNCYCATVIVVPSHGVIRGSCFSSSFFVSQWSTPVVWSVPNVHLLCGNYPTCICVCCLLLQINNYCRWLARAIGLRAFVSLSLSNAIVSRIYKQRLCSSFACRYCIFYFYSLYTTHHHKQLLLSLIPHIHNAIQERRSSRCRHRRHRLR